MTIPAFALALVLATGPAPAPGTLLDPNLVQRQVLPYGIVLLTLEDHSIPVVAWGVGYRVGSRNERPGITGISGYRLRARRAGTRAGRSAPDPASGRGIGHLRHSSAAGSA